MKKRRGSLIWSVILPFALFVVGGSLVLAVLWSLDSSRRSTLAFEQLARSNVQFLRDSRLTPTPGLVQKLGFIMGCDIYVRDRTGLLLPSPPEAFLEQIRNLPDGQVRSLPAGFQAMAFHAGPSRDLLFVRRTEAVTEIFNRGVVWTSLLLFWALSFALAWSLYRRLVVPLRNLSDTVLDPEEKPMPHQDREDEIGELARSFTRNREHLEEERTARVKAERFAMLGQMAASLAHEVHNPLSTVQMHAELLENDVPESGRGSLQWIRECSERIASIVNRWLYLASPEPGAPSRVNVRSVLEAALVPWSKPAQDMPRISLEMGEGAEWHVRADSRRLEEAISNVVRNAVQVSPENGRVNVTVKATEKDIVIRVEDEGPGFSGEALRRGTEMFFTGRMGGTGIGLSMANEVIRAIDGELRLSNSPEGSACVEMILPRA